MAKSKPAKRAARKYAPKNAKLTDEIRWRYASGTKYQHGYVQAINTDGTLRVADAVNGAVRTLDIERLAEIERLQIYGGKKNEYRQWQPWLESDMAELRGTVDTSASDAGDETKTETNPDVTRDAEGTARR